MSSIDMEFVIRLASLHFNLNPPEPQTQMGWFTADNASNNFSAIKEIGRQIQSEIPDGDPKQRYVR